MKKDEILEKMKTYIDAAEEQANFYKGWRAEITYNKQLAKILDENIRDREQLKKSIEEIVRMIEEGVEPFDDLKG